MSKVILCGYNWAGAKALDILLELGNEVFVYTHKNPPYINSVIDLCEKKNVPYSTEKMTIYNIPFKPDLIASIYYRYLIGSDIINLVNRKIFNLHPSLLPNYKGCSSLTWALINGENEVGYTYHYINEKFDEGKIILQKKIKVEDFDTQITLYHRVMFEALKDFKKVYEKVIKGFSGIAQKEGGRYYKRGCPMDGCINSDWEDDKVERFIRAMVYPPLPYAKYRNQEIKSFAEYKKMKNEQKT